MSTAAGVFQQGRYKAELLTIARGCAPASDRYPVPPPKPLLIAAPSDAGEYPVLVLLHGYLLYNTFYSQLIQHVASHGYIVIAPQLYTTAGPDSTEEIISTLAIIDWLSRGLSSANVLPTGVHADLSKLALAGHSRGGKTAFALALGCGAADPSPALKVSAIIGIDPVDGMDVRKQTKPPVLTYAPESFDLDAAVMVIGSGLGELKRNPLFPPCAPRGVNHRDFYKECRTPCCHLVARDYGHLDMLDDQTSGLRGKATYCLCKNGDAREPMRRFVGGATVAFMKAHLEGDSGDLDIIKNEPHSVPITLSVADFR